MENMMEHCIWSSKAKRRKRLALTLPTRAWPDPKPSRPVALLLIDQGCLALNKIGQANSPACPAVPGLLCPDKTGLASIAVGVQPITFEISFFDMF